MNEFKAFGVKDAARRLQVGRTTIYSLIAQGKLPSVKILKRRVILADDLDAFLVANRQQPKAEEQVA